MKSLSNGSWNLICLGAGISQTMAFAPFNQAYLAIISLVILFLSWHNSKPKQAAIRTYIYGLGLFGTGVSWVFVSIFYYGNATLLAASLLTLVFVSFWALFPALTAYLTLKIAQIRQINYLWVTPFIWILIEYYRGYWLLNGFPWLQIAYSQLDSAYAGFIPILGSYGTGFIIVVTAVLVTQIIIAKRRIVYLSVSIVTILITGYGLQKISWTEKIIEPIKITLIQGNISQDQKWRSENFIKNLLSYQQMTYNNWDSDVVVWPETAIPAYLHQIEADFLRPLAIEAIKHNTDLILSLPSKNSEKTQSFNSVITLGSKFGIYHKKHLLPFGEYLPLQPLSGWILDLAGMHLGSFTAGSDKQELLTAGGHTFLPSICYEDAFAEAILPQIANASYLVNVTNDAWFGDSLEPHQHMQIARMRALETGRYLVRANNTGVSGFIAPTGKIIKQAPLFTEFTLTHDIFPMQGLTPYANLGNQVIIGIILTLFLVLLGLNPLLLKLKQTKNTR